MKTRHCLWGDTVRFGQVLRMTTFARTIQETKSGVNLVSGVLLHLTTKPQQDLTAIWIKLSGKCFPRLLGAVCWFDPAAAPIHSGSSVLPALARVLAHPILSHPQQCMARSFQAEKDRTDNVLWPPCKIKSLFLYKRKYCPSFQSCNFNNLFKD